MPPVRIDWKAGSQRIQQLAVGIQRRCAVRFMNGCRLPACDGRNAAVRGKISNRNRDEAWPRGQRHDRAQFAGSRPEGPRNGR